MPTVIVNNQTVVHRTAGGIAQVFPDVCRTPAPPSPAPAIIPFPNVAVSADLARGSTSVTCDGSPVMLLSSNFATSTGDEPGTLLGIGSNAVKGTAKPVIASMDVKFDGDNVVRRMDSVVQNGGAGTANTAPAPVMVMPTLAVGLPVTDPEIPKVTRLEWVPAEPIVCGDKVMLEIETENFPGLSTLPLRIPRTQLLPGARHRLQHDQWNPQIRGNRGFLNWESRQHDWAPEIDIVAEQTAYEAVTQRSNKVEMRTVQDVPPQTIRRRHRVPKFVKKQINYEEHYLPNGEAFGWEYAFDAEIRNGKFTITREMDFTTLNVLVPGARVTREHLKRWKLEVESVWDRKWKLHRTACVRGDECDCYADNGCCSFAINIQWEDGGKHGVVQLNAGANRPAPADGGKNPYWWYSHTWWMAFSPGLDIARPHEFGHLIGLFDEYPGGACYTDRQWQRPFASLRHSIMGGGWFTFEQHMQEFKQWFDSKAGTVLGTTKLIRL
jgi:hypothetical protein